MDGEGTGPGTAGAGRPERLPDRPLGGAPGGLPGRWFAGAEGRATLALVALRVLYAYNWTDIGPALPALSRQMGIAEADWGLLLAAFFVGAGMLQIPAGLLARRYGNLVIALLGAAILGIAAIACAFAPNFPSLLLLRGVCGAGAGLFFSPAIAVVAGLHPEGRRGVPVGLFSSAYSAGAGLGVFVTALLIGPLGWGPALAVGGFGTLLLVPIVLTLVPRPSVRIGPRPARRPPWREIPAVLRSRAVWAIGVAFIGIEGASLAAGQFFVPYAEVVRGWSAPIAGSVGALFVFPSLFGGPVGGWIAERFTNRRSWLAVLTVGPSLLLVLVPWLPLAAVAVAATIFATAVGMIYAIMYVLPAYLPGIHDADLPLAIGLFNGIQLAGGAAVAGIVGWVVATYGYDWAWAALGGGAVLTLLALPLLPATGPRTTQGTAAARPAG